MTKTVSGPYLKKGTALLFAAITLSATSAQANVGEAYGFGSRSAALGGATGAWGADGYASYYNPAQLTLQTERRAVISFGAAYYQPVFNPIDNVVTDNDYVSDKPGPIRGNVSVDEYRPTFGTMLGATLRLMPQWWNLTAGVTGFLPLKHLAYMDTGQTFVPEYVLYRARTQRPQFAFALAVEPLTGFSAGAGVQAAFSLTTTADVFVQTDQPKPSTMRFAATLKPKFMPYLGLMYVSNKNDRKSVVGAESEQWAWSTGFVTRLAGSSDNDLSLNTGARVLNPLPALPFRFQALSAIYYDPLTFELSGSLQYLKQARLFLQVDYQVWSAYKAPALTIIPSSGVNITAGGPPAISPRDIIVPRVGHEYQLGRATLRAGYSYRAGIFRGAPNGAGNYLDPDRDIFTAGLGWRFDHILDFNVPWTADFNGAYHSLREQNIVKTEGNEVGVGSGDRKIGAPGYEADGHVWGVGVSMTVAL